MRRNALSTTKFLSKSSPFLSFRLFLLRVLTLFHSHRHHKAWFRGGFLICCRDISALPDGRQASHLLECSARYRSHRISIHISHSPLSAYKEARFGNASFQLISFLSRWPGTMNTVLTFKFRRKMQFYSQPRVSRITVKFSQASITPECPLQPVISLSTESLIPSAKWDVFGDTAHAFSGLARRMEYAAFTGIYYMIIFSIFLPRHTMQYNTHNTLPHYNAACIIHQGAYFLSLFIEWLMLMGKFFMQRYWLMPGRLIIYIWYRWTYMPLRYTQH